MNKGTVKTTQLIRTIDKKSRQLEALSDYDKVHVGDARKLAKKLEDESIALTVTSPPYFDMKDYGRPNQIGFGQKYDEYLDDLAVVFGEVFRATKSSGSLWIVIDTFRKAQALIPLPFDLAQRLKQAGWTLRDIVIWKKERTVPWVQPGATKRIFEYILVFSKGSSDFTYNQDQFRETVDLKRWWVRYPERYNPKGKAPEQIWSYDIPTQGSWGDSYIQHFCPLPKELVSRIIQQTTSSDDLVLDPFSGSGTVPAVSKLLGRRYIGFELNPDYVAMFKKYLKNELALKKVGDASNAQQSALSFEQTIVCLRKLKFGRLLLREINKTHSATHAKIFVFESSIVPEQRFKLYAAEYLIVIENKKNINVMKKLIEDAISRPPLSKFGIQPCFSYILKVEEVPLKYQKRVFFRYTTTNSHFHSGSIGFDDAWNSDGSLFSPIQLEVKEPHDY